MRMKVSVFGEMLWPEKLGNLIVLKDILNINNIFSKVLCSVQITFHHFSNQNLCKSANSPSFMTAQLLKLYEQYKSFHVLLFPLYSTAENVNGL